MALPGVAAGNRAAPRCARSAREVAKSQGRKRSVEQVMRSPSRRQMMARPSRLAQTETMPGKGFHPNNHSSSRCAEEVASKDSMFLLLRQLSVGKNICLYTVYHEM